MANEQTQNQNDSPATDILGAILPIIFLLLFIFQMVHSFFQE